MRCKPRTSRLMILLTYVLLAFGMSNPASAAPFTWRDDPFSFPAQVGTPTWSGNTETFHMRAVNATSQILPELAVITPWVFAEFGNTTYAMQWSNPLNGWFNSNVEGSSLLITLDNILGRLLFGGVAADPAGTVPLFPTQTVNGVTETVQADALVPFLNLGSFAAFEVKNFDMVLTYHFGDNRQLTDAARPITDGFSNTISPVPVPEPGTIALLGTGLLGLGFLRRRKSA